MLLTLLTCEVVDNVYNYKVNNYLFFNNVIIIFI